MDLSEIKNNLVYDSEGNLIEDHSKNLKISYDWRGMPVEFRMETRAGNVLENTRSADWERELVTHYTGIGTEVRENYRDGSLQDARVVVNMPQGLGRYMPEDASAPVVPSTTLDENGKPTDWSIFNPKFEWYLKNHLGSTMLVYGTAPTTTRTCLATRAA